MTVDSTTEIIAHFIGQFDLAVEAPRLQILYDPFILERLADELTPPEPAPPVEVVAPYTVRSYSGAVTVEPVPSPADALAGTSPAFAPDVTIGAAAAASLPTAPFAPPIAAASGPVPVATGRAEPQAYLPELPTPNDIAIVTAQTLVLFDDDLITATGEVAFAPLAPLHADLAAVRTLAEQLSDAVIGDLTTDAAPSHATALALHARIEAAAAPAIAGLEATVLRGDDAQGVVIDGAAAAALPDWREHLPEHLRDSDAAGAAAADEGIESGGGDGKATPGTAVSGESVAGVAGTTDGNDVPPEAGDRDPFEAVPAGAGSDDAGDLGDEVVTGANLAVNEVAIAWQWLDAPVIVVKGDVVDLDVVVQHNLLRDRDTSNAEPTAAAAADAAASPKAPPTPTSSTPASTTPASSLGTDPASAAAVAATSEPAAPIAKATPIAEPEPGAGPSEAINAARITATSTADDDAATPGSPAQPSTAVVKTVAGDVGLTNTVEQHSFVTDMDRTDVALSAAETTIGTGGNLTVNEAFFTEIGYRFDLIVVDGDMIKLDVVNQLNVLLDDDGIDAPLGVPGATTPQNNVVMNRADLSSHGVDTVTAMQDAFAAAAEQLREGASTLTPDVLADRLFAGKDMVAALHIQGDLMIANMIDQRTYLGDQDQVHLARDALAAPRGAPVEVTTGANALLNAAKITEHGLDSVIMAGGDVYDDALIYQAGLIDTDEQPGAVDLPALANEAVAFLADGFTTPAAPDMAEAPVVADAGSVAPADLMQTMLA